MTAGLSSLPNDDFASAIIVRAQDPAASLAAFRNRRCVVNEADATRLSTFVQAALQTPVEVNPFFGSVHLSGSHRQSVEMVAGYEADVAAVHRATLAQLVRRYPALMEKVRVLCWTYE